MVGASVGRLWLAGAWKEVSLAGSHWCALTCCTTDDPSQLGPGPVKLSFLLEMLFFFQDRNDYIK